MTSYFATVRCTEYLPLPLIFSLLLFSLLCACGIDASAAEATRDIRIVVDISGSMKKNDPHLLRQPAVRLLADLLPKGTQAGVWTFGKYVNMLVPLKPVTDEWRSMAKTRAADINSIAAFTNIGEAIETASAGWQHPNPNSDRHLILLTDGWVDISPSASDNHQARQLIINKLLPMLKNNGVKFHTLALANDVDKELLQLLAANSQGSYHEAHHADDLLKVFVNAFDQSVKPQQVPIEADGFNIDSGINEFTALIFKKATASKPVALIAPDGNRISAKEKDSKVKWLTDAKFDLITISAPTAGKWQLIADLDPSSRVTIISDLSLQVKGLSAMADLGSKPTLNISLTEKDKTITREDFLHLLTVRVKHQHGEHKSEQKLSDYADPNNTIPSDGIYHFQLPEALTSGEHQFSVEVDGQTFKRVYKQSLLVTAPAKKITETNLSATTTPLSTPTPLIPESPTEPTAEVSPEPEDKDEIAEAAPELEDDSFSAEESPEELSELDEDEPPKSNTEKTPEHKPAPIPMSQQTWFKWAVGVGIFLINLLLFALGTLWYRRTTKRQLEEAQLEEDGLQEDSIETSPVATPTIITENTTVSNETSSADDETQIATSYEGDILEDPLKDLHADEFDNDLDMPDEDTETRA